MQKHEVCSVHHLLYKQGEGRIVYIHNYVCKKQLWKSPKKLA